MNAAQPDMAHSVGTRRAKARLPLLLAGPLLLALGLGGYYLAGGQRVSTDNAYIKANKVAVSAQVSGAISAVAVRENQPVHAGDILFTIDPAPFRLAHDRAAAHLAEVATEIRALQASYRQSQIDLQLAQGDLEFAQREVDRQSKLAKNNLLAEGSFDATQHARDNAGRQVTSLQQDVARLLASLGGSADSPVEAHPSYLAALADEQRTAWSLAQTNVAAPFDGVASKVPQLGQYVTTGMPVISIVDAGTFWIEANFKETQLTRIRAGQPVRVSVDSYPDVIWQGSVDSIGQASGAEFALLPPQNASGNWVKVAQRIPVRIALTPVAGQPQLRAGISAKVTVDTNRVDAGTASFGTAGFGTADFGTAGSGTADPDTAGADTTGLDTVDSSGRH